MSQALYRRYRPETFDEVIGQEHVTGPLMQALRTARVNHAYLFSGPRGCGKTTSARILARILNCAENTEATPRATPCGLCESCQELGRGGSGSLDVVEIDAASHGGVDDARDLRERATFSPSRDRFKIFILDEAHMVTPAGFNALLKIVEEPPPYLKFIFATTEPEKVIGTIRSRTHHYPFRLVPPEVLQPYLEQMCDLEGIAVGQGVLPMVVRAGGGSVRDSLSILDQLIAGAQGNTIDYERASGLLGFTPITLLDDVVEALSASDGGSLFRVVDQIIATGHEPRRFVEDLLERFRDLVVISVSGDRADAVFRGFPVDQLERMRRQADGLGLAELSRAADVTNAALSEMTGATSPRLHLELLCARLLLPSADDGVRGIAARLERLERLDRAVVPAVPGVKSALPTVASPSTSTVASPATDVETKPSTGQSPPWAEDEAPPATSRQEASDVASPAHRDVAAVSAPVSVAAPVSAAADEPAAASVAVTTAAPAPVPAAQAPAPPSTTSVEPGAAAVSIEAELLRRRWPEVLATLSTLRKATWALVSQNAQIATLTDEVLTLAFPSEGLTTAFRSGPHADLVKQALHESLGVQARVEAITDGGNPGPSGGTAGRRGPVGSARSSGSGHSPATGRPGTTNSGESLESPLASASTVIPASAHRGSSGSGRPMGVSAVDPAAAAASWGSLAPATASPPQTSSSQASPSQIDTPQAGAAVAILAEPQTPLTDSVPTETSIPVVEQDSHSAGLDYAEDTYDPFEQEEEPASTHESAPSTTHASTVVSPAATSMRTAAVAAVGPVSAQEPDTPFTEEDAWEATRSADSQSELVGAPLVAQMLGGKVVEEIIESDD